MKTKILKLATALVLCLALPNTVLSDVAVRQMNVRQGPETVFDQPLSDIVPGLSGATATRRNGRVGGEFVFWGYKLSDGTPAYFYACAADAGVDCIARRGQICNSPPPKVLSENQSMGQVQKLTCRLICAADAPSASPCCTGIQKSSDLQVGLVSCGG